MNRSNDNECTNDVAALSKQDTCDQEVHRTCALRYVRSCGLCMSSGSSVYRCTALSDEFFRIGTPPFQNPAVELRQIV